jgi:hypothetical protein
MSAATSTKKPKSAKTKKTGKVAKAASAAKVKKETATREDPRVGILLSALIRNPSASYDDLVQALKAKNQDMSRSAVTLVKRGFQQTFRALTAANMLAT